MRHWSGHNRWCPGKIWFSRSKRGRRTIFLTCGEHFWFPFFIILKTIFRFFLIKKRKYRTFILVFNGCLGAAAKRVHCASQFCRNYYYYFATSTYKFNCLFNNALFKADFQVASSQSRFYLKSVLKSSTSFTSDPLKLHFSFGMWLFI